jgi:transcriptional regulator with XRE-family HTH domain
MPVIVIKADRIKEEILRRNITQERFARDVLEVNPSYFSQLLSGRREPGPNIRQRIMDELRVGFDDLFEIRAGEPVGIAKERSA